MMMATRPAKAAKVGQTRTTVTGGDEEGMTIEDADEAAAAATGFRRDRGRQARAALAKQTGGNSAEAGGGESQPRNSFERCG